MEEQRYPEPTAGALIFSPEGTLFLMKSHKWRHRYVVPGGHIELGERMEEALRREIKEETGLDIHNVRFLCFQEFVYDDAFWKRRHFIFFDYTCRTDSTEAQLNSEAQEYVWVSPEEALRLPLDPYTERAIQEYLNRYPVRKVEITLTVPSIHIQEIGPDQFSLYDAIPNWYRVESVLRVEVMDGGLGGFRLVEEQAAEPYARDYDSHHDDNPAAWAASFDVSHWGMFVATDGEQPVGGAAVALDTPVYPMDHFQRRDLAVLWDIRVHPDHRGQGIGAKLFRYAADWARGKGYGQLGVETDSANVPACRFYLRQGCTLGAIHRFGYIACPEVAHNAMLLWYLDLSPEQNQPLLEGKPYG